MTRQSRQPDRAGRFVAIVGPSGSGKDTLIDWLRERLAGNKRFMFVRRVVTRAADANLEDHATMDNSEFAAAEAEGVFAVVWQAHGLSYAIPADAREHVDAGGVAIANGSRRALPELAAVFPGLSVIELTVDRDVLAARLSGRGREDDAEVSARLAQRQINVPAEYNARRVDNSGPIEAAGETVLAHLGRIAEHTPA